jgi:hypothetical protein
VTQDNIVKFAEPGAFEDPLTEVLRCGARKLLADAIEAEVSDFLDRHSRFLTEEGQQRRGPLCVSRLAFAELRGEKRGARMGQ